MANPLAGKGASVLVGTNALAMDTWEFPTKAGNPKFTNFTSNGFAEYLAGVLEGECTLKGPYDSNNMALTVGNTYAVTLRWSNMLNLTFSGFIKGLKSSQQVEDLGRVEVNFQPTGSFSVSIV